MIQHNLKYLKIHSHVLYLLGTQKLQGPNYGVSQLLWSHIT